MSPRGVAIPDVRERLFDAAVRVLSREGPAALTSRAITGEAGCAKGMLHAHFDGLDEFVAELVLDRFARCARQAAELPGQAGRATAADNLGGLALALLTSLDPTMAGLAMTRPATSLRIRQALEAGAPGLDAIQDSITAYLDAEVRLGRLADTTDTASIALALVGTLHHLVMTGWIGTPDPRDQALRLIGLLVGERPGDGAGSEDSEQPPHGSAEDEVA
jgi:AcrR family transcriptional regulator